jgi:hypothetical protein
VDDEIAELFLEEIVPDAMQLHAAIRRAVIAEKFVSGKSAFSCEPFSTCSNFQSAWHWQRLFWVFATERGNGVYDAQGGLCVGLAVPSCT